jgi:hypothetical protein
LCAVHATLHPRNPRLPPRASQSVMAVEWNKLVKPVIYVWELVLTSVVTFGTADKLLFYSQKTGKTSCALNDSIGTCAFTVAAGSICLIGAISVLWRRLIAAFTDSSFNNDDESVACALLSFGWFIIASVITANISLPSTSNPETFRVMRNVVASFAWFSSIAYFCSAGLAYIVPATDRGDIFERLRRGRANGSGAFREDATNVAADDSDAPTGETRQQLQSHLQLHGENSSHFVASQSAVAADSLRHRSAPGRRGDREEDELLRGLSLRRVNATGESSYSAGDSTGTIFLASPLPSPGVTDEMLEPSQKNHDAPDVANIDDWSSLLQQQGKDDTTPLLWTTLQQPLAQSERGAEIKTQEEQPIPPTSSSQ